MSRLLPLLSLRAFEAAARHLSFKRAAEELNVTPTAISHQIRVLEEAVGVRLFERKVRRVEMTTAGQALYPTLRDSFDAMGKAIDRLRQGGMRAAVTLSATTAFTSRWLIPRVASFQTAYPDLDLNFHATNDVVDLNAGAAKIAIRYGRGPYPGLHAELLLQDRFAPVCSPRLGVSKMRDVGKHPLVHFKWQRADRDKPVWQRWFAKAGLPYAAPKGEIVFSDETHAIQAAIAGHGIALASLVLVADDLANGTLVRLPGPELDGYSYYMVCHESVRDEANVLACRQWLRNEAALFTNTSAVSY